MNTLISLHESLSRHLARLDPLLPLLARLIFAAVLLGYFWASAATKVGDGLLGVFMPSTGAYAQIFPRAFEAVGYDASRLGLFHWAVVVAGTWAELLLPLMIVLGALTRLASLGMIGFVAVQTLTDLYGHGAISQPETLGAFFDRMADAPILDQRALWVMLLATLAVKGAGRVSVDGWLAARRARALPAAA